MRDSLTVLAMLLIVVLTTALVGPYFVDWNAHRGQIEKRLSDLTGAHVAVTGPIDVKLLPRPIFRLQNLSVSGLSPRAGTVSAARVDVELSLTALLRGEFSFVDADVTAPKVVLPLGADRSVLLPELGGDTAGRINLVHIVLRDGTIVLRGEDGQEALSVGGIAGDGEAESLAGPFKFTGRVDTPRGSVGLRVATGTFDAEKLRLKIGVDASEAAPKSDFDGFVTVAPGGSGSALSLDGALIAGGARTLAGSTDVVPWHVTATVHAQAGHLDVTNGELRAGADGRALIATLAADADLGARAAARATIHARQLDLGRLAVPPEDDSAPAPVAQPGQGLAALGTLLTDADLTAALPLPVTLDYGVDTVVAGSLTLGGVSGHATLAAGKPVAGTLAITAADGSHVAFNGSFEPGPAAVYKGSVEAASAHLQRLADSFDTDLPAVAAAVRQTLPVDAFKLAGIVNLSSIGFAAHDIALELDRSRFAGTVTLTRAVGQDHARLFADLTSDALDLDALPDWRDTARAAADLDVSLTLVARATRLASGDTGSVKGGRIALELSKSGQVVTLDRLSLADIGGATAEFSGRSDGTTAHAEGRLDAKQLRQLFGLLDRVAPALATDQLLARADALSPALLSVSLDATLGSDGTVVPTLLTLDGTAASTTVTLHLRPTTTQGLGAGAPAPGSLDLTLDAPDAGTLLRQFGFATAASTAVGRGRVDLKARRDPRGIVDGTLTAALGPTVLTADGRGDIASATGHVALKGPNVAPLARVLLLATPEAGAVWPVDAAATLSLHDRQVSADGLAGRLLGTPFSGKLALALPPAGANPDPGGAPPLTGALAIDKLPLTALAALVLGPLPAPKAGVLWPEGAFAPALLSLPRGEVAVTVASLPLTDTLVARDAKATLRLGRATLTLADLTARLKDGRVGGTATLRRDGAAASLAGHLDWSDLPVTSTSLGGLSHAALDLSGSGNSLAAIMASLAGSGTLGIADARLPRFEPAAITRVIASTDAGTSTLDESAIADQLGQDLDHGALGLGTVSTPVTVAAGTVRSEPVKVQGPLVQSETSGTLDLRTLLLTLKTTASLRVPPKDWTGSPPEVGVLWKGPFGSPTRQVDVAALVNGIAARAIARDQARIEAFQEDVRERAFFARRLKAIEAEQQAVRDKAKADADADRQRLQQMIQGNAASPPSSADTARPALPVPVDPARATPVPPRRPTAAKPMELH